MNGSPAEHLLRVVVGLSVVAAAVVVLRVVGNYGQRPHARVVAPGLPEERIDSVALSRLAAMPATANGRSHRVIAILDPSSPDARFYAAALAHLEEDRSFHVAVATYLVPLNGHQDPATMNITIAGQCAQRQGKLVRFLDAAAKRTSNNDEDWEALAVESKIERPVDFKMCVLRRETVEEVSDGQALMHRLALEALPAFVIDSTVVRGRISVDSVRARLRAARR